MIGVFFFFFFFFFNVWKISIFLVDLLVELSTSIFKSLLKLVACCVEAMAY